MKKILLPLFGLLLLSLAHVSYAEAEPEPISIVKNMFTYYAEAQDITKFDTYFSKDFILISNQKTYDYSTFKNQQIALFKALKSITVLDYSEMFASGNKVLTQATIQLGLMDGKSGSFNMTMITYIEQGKIAKIWAITYPVVSNKVPSKK